MNKVLAYFIVFSLIPLSALLTDCTKDKALLTNPNANCDTVPVSYSADIVPIIQTSCATNQGPGTGCHDAWIFEYSNLKSRIDNGTIEYRVFQTRDMPVIPNSFGIDSLTAEEYLKLQCWIAAGAPEN